MTRACVLAIQTHEHVRICSTRSEVPGYLSNPMGESTCTYKICGWKNRTESFLSFCTFWRCLEVGICESCDEYDGNDNDDDGNEQLDDVHEATKFAIKAFVFGRAIGHCDGAGSTCECTDRASNESCIRGAGAGSSFHTIILSIVRVYIFA